MRQILKLIIMGVVEERETYFKWFLVCHFIREYGSTLYVGMARKKNGRLYISIASDELKSLLI